LNQHIDDIQEIQEIQSIKKQKRCPKGSRRHPPKTGQCVQNKDIESRKGNTKRCPKGSRRHPPKTGNCLTKEQIAALPKRRCPKGYRKFRGECVQVSEV